MIEMMSSVLRTEHTDPREIVCLLSMGERGML